MLGHGLKIDNYYLLTITDMVLIVLLLMYSSLGFKVPVQFEEKLVIF